MGEFSYDMVDQTLYWAVYNLDNIKVTRALNHGGDPSAGDPQVQTDFPQN